jgi:hypothetical protein
LLIFKLVRLGLYEIDSGLNPLDEDDPRMGHLMAYADLNSDMYTDIIALAEDKSMLNLFYFNPVHLRFYLGNELKTSDCSKITNVAVGRSQSHLRIFVTCNSNSGSTIVRFYDRTDKGYNELPQFITIEKNSHPFIADLNGDYLEDVMFTDPSSSGIKVAFQADVYGEETIIVRDFATSIAMEKPEPDCITQRLSSPRFTSPHSASLIDIDGDCMADLFLTVEDSSSGRKFYEIWLRRETQTTLDLSAEMPAPKSGKTMKHKDSDEEFPANTLTGLQSFCLVTREEIPSGIHNLFALTDIDRDGMVDMVYLKDDRSPMTLYTHYNRLKNQQFAANQKTMTPGLGFSVKNICAAPNRPIKELQDIFLKPS